MWLPCSKPSQLPTADALAHTHPIHTHPEVKGAYYGFLLKGLYFGTLDQKYGVHSLRHGLHCVPRLSQRIRIWSPTGVTTGRTQPLLALFHYFCFLGSLRGTLGSHPGIWEHSQENWTPHTGLPGPVCPPHSPCPSQPHPHQPPGCLSNNLALSSRLAFEPQVSLLQNVLLPGDS